MEAVNAITALAALAHETRLGVFRALVRCGPEGLSAGALSERFAVAPPTLSFHLKELAAAGLVQARREGRQVFYALNAEGTRDLIAFLTEDCCEGDPALCGVSEAVVVC